MLFEITSDKEWIKIKRKCPIMSRILNPIMESFEYHSNKNIMHRQLTKLITFTVY